MKEGARRHRRVFVGPIPEPELIPSISQLPIREIAIAREIEAISEFTDYLIANIQQDPIDVVDELKAWKNKIREDRVHAPSRPAICVADLHFDVAQALLLQNRHTNPLRRRLAYDYSTGINAVADSIILAEKEIMGEGEKAVENLIPSGYPPSVKRRMRAQGLELAKVFADILTHSDKTGIELVGRVAIDLEEGRCPFFNRPVTAPEILVMGSNFASDYYTLLYPLSELA